MVDFAVRSEYISVMSTMPPKDMGNMNPEDYAIAMKLCEKDEDFKDLWDEHQTLKTKLKELEARRFLTAEDEKEVKRLKRLKLTGKDKIAVKISEYKVAVSGPA